MGWWGWGDIFDWGEVLTSWPVTSSNAVVIYLKREGLEEEKFISWHLLNIIYDGNIGDMG